MIGKYSVVIHMGKSIYFVVLLKSYSKIVSDEMSCEVSTSVNCNYGLVVSELSSSRTLFFVIVIVEHFHFLLLHLRLLAKNPRVL